MKRLAIQVGKIDSRRMLVPTSFDFLIDLFVLVACFPPHFCLIRMLPGKMFRLCSMTLRSTPIMSAIYQAITLENFFRSAISMVLVFLDRSAPTCISFLGDLGGSYVFLFGNTPLMFLGLKLALGLQYFGGKHVGVGY